MIIDEVVYLEHFGVKGMKWGVRNDRPSSTSTSTKPGYDKNGVRLKPDDMHVKLKDGGSITAVGKSVPAITRFVAKYSPKFKEGVNNSSSFSLKDPTGKTVGDMQLFKESPTSMNIVWVGVKNSQRGHGYATAVMKAAIDHAKEQGLSTVTLEVPGNSPDARHIYEKLGFKVTHEVSPAEGDSVWGGLTGMSLDLKKSGKSTVKHSTSKSNEVIKKTSGKKYEEITNRK